MRLGLYGIQGGRQGVVEGHRDRCRTGCRFRMTFPAFWGPSQVRHVEYKKRDSPGISKIRNGCCQFPDGFSRLSKGVWSSDEHVAEVVGAAPDNVQRRVVSLVKEMLDYKGGDLRAGLGMSTGRSFSK